MVEIRPALLPDLSAINHVVERAVMTWRLPERVKRLALPSYRYHPHDLDHQRMLVAVAADASIVGVAALEEADARDLPAAGPAQLLHGLYVDPEWQGRGIGTRLLEAALAACGESACRGLLVKAQPDAVGFFQARGLERLPVRDPDRDYPHRYWAPVAARAEPAGAGTCAATRV